MNANDQLSLGDWSAEPEPAAAMAVPVTSPETCAAMLDAHPDYRVLRRLVPQLSWPLPEGAKTARVLILDTETTGLDARQEQIIELAMLSVLVDRDTGLPVGEASVFESFEDPGYPIPKEITEITGITDDMVRGQRIDDAQVMAMVEQADVIVAHNAGFDRPFVEARLPVFAQKPWNCSFVGIDWKKEGGGSAKLEFLAYSTGKFFYDAHRALTDCHALLQVLIAPLSDGRTGLKTLLEGAQSLRYKLSATGSPFESKDKLKARGYRWDGEQKAWWCALKSPEALQEECAWLKAEVYGGRAARVALEVQDSTVQFSGRPGRLSQRTL